MNKKNFMISLTIICILIGVSVIGLKAKSYLLSLNDKIANISNNINLLESITEVKESNIEDDIDDDFIINDSISVIFKYRKRWDYI